MDKNIYYLQGVIDTLKDIITNNTNIKLSNIENIISKKEYEKEFEDEDINENEINIIDKIETAKNYIILLDQMCNNRIKLLSKIDINSYIDILNKNISEVTIKLKNRGLEEKKIYNLIKNKFLKSFETKFLLKYKYEDVSLTTEDIFFLEKTNKERYNYNKYKIFNKQYFVNNFLNYTISIFDISDMINFVINNKFCNIKYIFQSRSKLEDPFSFYYLEKIENDKFYWKMDCRLHEITNYLREHLLQYSIELFKNIYNQVFHDYTYRNDFETEKDILQYEAIQLLKNIYQLSNSFNFTKIVQKLFINVYNEFSEFPEQDKFKYNLKSDDTQQKSLYKDLKSDYNINQSFKESIFLLFEDFNDENFTNILEKIKN